MQQEMFEEVIHKMLTGKFCGMCLSKMHYADKAVYPLCMSYRNKAFKTDRFAQKMAVRQFYLKRLH